MSLHLLDRNRYWTIKQYHVYEQFYRYMYMYMNFEIMHMYMYPVLIIQLKSSASWNQKFEYAEKGVVMYNLPIWSIIIVQFEQSKLYCK